MSSGLFELRFREQPCEAFGAAETRCPRRPARRGHPGRPPLLFSGLFLSTPQNSSGSWVHKVHPSAGCAFNSMIGVGILECLFRQRRLNRVPGDRADKNERSHEKMNARERLGQTALGHGAASAFPSKASIPNRRIGLQRRGEFPGAGEAVSAGLCRAAEPIQVVEEVTSPRNHYTAFGRALDRVVSEIRYDRLR